MTATLFDLTLKATVPLLAAGAAALILRRRSAAVRHLVWTAAISSLVALPLASAALPEWRVTALPPLPAPPIADVRGVEKQRRGEASRETVTRRTREAPPPADDSPRRGSSTPFLDISGIVVPLWLAGGGLLVVWLCIGLIRVAALSRASPVIRDPHWTGLLARLARQVGVTRPVTLRRSAGPAIPMTWGAWRPIILLPPDADSWSGERRRDVLLHELAHVRRHDFLTQIVASLACALYWFHPLAWLAARRLRVERERACDDHVIRSGRRPSDYAGHLLDIARSLGRVQLAPLAGLAMARRSHLADRLLDVLDAQRDRGDLSVRAAAPLWVATALVVVPLAALRPARPQPEAAPEPRPVAAVEMPLTAGGAVSPDPLPLRASSSTADTLKGCAGRRSRSHSSSVSTNDAGLSVSLTEGRCRVRFVVEGDVEFTEDFTDVASISGGGEGFLEFDDGETVRRVDLRQGRGGSLERAYTVDGAARPYDDTARAWFTDVLTYVFRRTGIQAARRARWILDRRGVEGLYQEIALLEGDYARRRYYQVGVESGKLDAGALERVVTQAGGEIESDFELAELLILAAESQAFTEGLQAAIARAAVSIDSDFERRRVLEAALRREDVSPAVQGALLEAATGIESDFELAQFLIDVAERYTVDAALRVPYFAAVKTIDSDHELGRTLRALVDRRADPPVLLDVLVAARGLESDFELAQLLVAVARARRIDDALRPAFVEAMNGIGSDYERERVERALERSGRAELE